MQKVLLHSDAYSNYNCVKQSVLDYKKYSNTEGIREGTDIVWHGGLQIPAPFNTLDLGSYKGLVFADQWSANCDFHRAISYALAVTPSLNKSMK
jgi:hypothetical protein